MAEIEIKARVKNRQQVIDLLNKKTTYIGSVIKDDAYWGKSVGSKRKIRVRKETRETGTDCLLTYKRKEKHCNENGSVIEVNDEMECTVSSPEPLEAFLKDSGYIVTLNKHKEVMDWTLKLEEIAGIKNLSATFELCAVPPLGDFMEIEIISPVTDEVVVKALNEKLEKLLETAGLSKEDIESQYYSTLLRQYQEEHKSV